jgi:pyrophosphatase PpaX
MGAPPDAVLFDLDGTLIDSIPLILASFRHALDAHGLEHVTSQQVLSGLGTPLSVHLGHMAGAGADVDALVATYRAYNHAHHDGLVRAFDGIVEGLGALEHAGIPLGIVTSKRVPMARRGLEVAGLAHDFRVLLGPEDVRHPKPHPEPLLLAAARLNVAPERTLYVGDSPHDLAAARAAGMGGIGVGWGPFDNDTLLAEGPERMLDAPRELAHLASTRLTAT